jgi:hypothetical protein
MQARGWCARWTFWPWRADVSLSSDFAAHGFDIYARMIFERRDGKRFSGVFSIAFLSPGIRVFNCLRGS